MIVVEFLFWGSLLCFVLSWGVYPAMLAIWAWRKKESILKEARHTDKPLISIIVAAYNEEDCIQKRIQNLLGLSGDYPIEIIVGSDGSTDKTVEIVRSLGHPDVRLMDFPENRGRSMVHNDCCAVAKGDILLFTDAETTFASDFLELILPHFGNPDVGAVSGRIVYLNEDSSDIGRSAGLYWRYEELIRIFESRVGILGFGTGAALAIRRTAYQNIGFTEDIDYAATLAAAAKGYRILYEPRAKAFDYISETSAGAFKTRIRQTSRCFKSVLRRIFSPDILLRRPGVFASALMHKTFRHVTPFFMLAILFANFFLLGSGWLYSALFFLQTFFYAGAAAGGIFQDRLGGPLQRLVSLFYNFLLINTSRGIGVYKALRGLDRATYKTVR